MEIIFTFKARKDLKRLPKTLIKRIITKIKFYSSQQNFLKFAEPLKDKSLGSYRFRVGDYRIFFDLENNNIIILKIGHRRLIYK